jgi:arabinofuranan 3-O-arabinosyltransferase
VVPGLIVAGATALALFAPWGRAALVLPALLGFPFVASWYVLKQARNHYAMGVEWPSVFRPAHQVVLITVLLLAADVVIGAFGRWRRACPPSGAAGPDLRADDVPQSAGSRP